MGRIQTLSVEAPLGPDVARRAADVVVAAESMGILEPAATVRSLDLAGLRAVLERVAAAGIGARLVAGLPDLAALGPERLGRALDEVLGALEASPLPRLEWPALLRLFGAEALAGLLGISIASLHRYARGSRPTPDEVAERLHFIARIAGDLRGAYNDIGVRRWFQRKRSVLGNRAPASFLRGDWSPDHRGPKRVRDLARSLASAQAS